MPPGISFIEQEGESGSIARTLLVFEYLAKTKFLLKLG